MKNFLTFGLATMAAGLVGLGASLPAVLSQPSTADSLATHAVAAGSIAPAIVSLPAPSTASTIPTPVVSEIAAPPKGGYDAQLSNYPYPYPTHKYRFFSQVKEMEMAYMDVLPTRPNGRTVLLLHGKNFSGGYWQPTIAALANAGFRVVVPDQIGFGKSSKPQRYQFSFQTLGDNTFGLLRNLKIEKVAVVGHSMGGMLACRMALMRPTVVTQLALVNPIGLEDWKTMVPYSSVEENYRKEMAATPQSLKEYQRTSYFGGQWKPAYDSLLTIPLGWLNHPDYPKVAWNAALTSDMIFTQPVVYEFPLIKQPTLLIIGQRDRTALGKERASAQVASQMGNYPLLGQKAAARIPHARLVAIPNAGHLPQVESFPVYIAALRSFLL